MGRLSGIIDGLRHWIVRDEKLIESQKRFGWRSFRIEGGRKVDLTDAHLGAARERIAANKKRLEAFERRDAQGS